jgi:hypothetical protein
MSQAVWPSGTLNSIELSDFLINRIVREWESYHAYNLNSSAFWSTINLKFKKFMAFSWLSANFGSCVFQIPIVYKLSFDFGSLRLLYPCMINEFHFLFCQGASVAC